MLDGDITPTYLEYKAAMLEDKHILVFVSPDIKKSFLDLKDEMYDLYYQYQEKTKRLPSSPLEPFKDWIYQELHKNNLYSNIFKKADPFIWAFLFEIIREGNWLYEFDIAHSINEVKRISDMLSTSFRSVVHFINKRKEIQEMQSMLDYLDNYSSYTLELLEEKNKIMNHESDWSTLLEKAIQALNHQKDIIQNPEINPIVVNRISECYAASLYQKEGNILSLIGSTSNISANQMYSLDEDDIYVVDALTKRERIIAYREDKNAIYLTLPVNDFVVCCLHYRLEKRWTKEQVIAYEKEIEYAIIDGNEYFLDFFKLILGGRI